jgi:hypothetical protein
MPIYRTTVALEYGAGGPGVNTFHVDSPGDGEDNLVLSEFGSRLETAYTLWAPFMRSSSTASWDGLWVNVDTDEELPAGEDWIVTSTTGTTTGSLATVLSVVVGYRTGLRSRSGQGRTFLPPMNEAASDSAGTPSASALTAANNFGLLLLEGGAVGGPVVYSTTDGVGRPITSVRVRDVFAVLRSRRD